MKCQASGLILRRKILIKFLNKKSWSEEKMNQNLENVKSQAHLINERLQRDAVCSRLQKKIKMEEEQILNKREIKPTASRILVLRYFLEKRNATSLIKSEEDLYNSDKSTLYRSLKTFERLGIIHSVDDGTGIIN